MQFNLTPFMQTNRTMRAEASKSYRKMLMTFFMLLISGFTFLQAQNIVGWDMNGLSAYGPSPFSPPSNLASGITSSGLVRGSGFTTINTAATNAWGGNGITSTDLASSIAANDVVTFTIVPDASSTVSLTQISPYNIRRSGTGPTAGQWQYRINAGPFIDIGSPITWGTVTTATGNPQGAISLSGIGDLQNVAGGTTITFRLVLWGGASAGTWYFNNFGAAAGGIDLAVTGTVTTASAPSVTTGGVSGITTTGANVNSNEVTNENNSSVTARGVVWGTAANPTVPSANSTSNGSGLGTYNSVIAGLVANTQYNVRAYATNSIGTSYGANTPFTTLPLAPTANAQTLVTPTSFQANWTAPTQGSAPATYTLEVSELFDFSSIVATVSGLTGTNNVVSVNPTTTYYYRVRMVNATGPGAYSNIIGPFTTPAPAGPVVITNPALDVTNNGAQLFGSIDPNGATVNAFFDYGTTLAYGTSLAASPSSLSGTGAQDISLTIGGLQPNTLYNFRARANAGVNGNNLTFITLANTPAAITYGAPTSTTVTISAVGANGNPAVTQYAITSTNFPGDFLQFNGTFGPTPFFQTNADWANTVVAGLNSSTTYQFQAIARNSDNLQTGAGPLSSSATTACPVPVFTVTNITNSAATITLSNSTGNFEYVINTSPIAPGAPGTAETGNIANASGLTATTNYYAHVRNVCGVNFSTWATVPFLTLANPVGLVVYDFATCSGCATSAPTTVAANVNASVFSRGAGITATTGAGFFNNNNFNATNFSDAFAQNEFVTFDVQAAPGNLITYTSLSYVQRISGTGPPNTRVGYSTNGGTSWTYMTPDPVIMINTNNYSVTWNIPTPFTTAGQVIFRIWAWGASGTGGTYRVDDVVLNGIVSSVCNAPITQADNIIINNVTNTSADITWTNSGTADSRFVFVGAVGAGTPPLANGTEYFGSATFGAGSAVGSWFCVYNGTGNSISVSNLVAGTNYRVFVSNANCTGSNIQYNTATATDNPNTFTTTNVAAATLNAGPLSNFGSPCVGQEVERTVIISGVDLDGSTVSVSAPVNCAVSLVSGENYTSSVTIPYSGSAFSVPVYVRFIGSSAGVFSNNLTVSGGGAANLFVAVNGSPINTAPVVSTGNVSFISTTGATIAGSYTLGCAPAFSEYGIEYSVSPAFLPGNGAIVQAAFTGNNFSVALSNLAINTVYYYRAYGINQSVTYYGNVGSFSTLSGALETIYNYGDNTTGAPFFVHPTLTGSSVVRSATGWTNSTPCGSGFSGFGITSAQTTFNTATNPYVNVDIVPNVIGNQLQVERISVQLRSSASGPNAAMLAYSIDGGTTWINRGVAEIPGVGGCGAINPGATAWVLPSPVVIGYPLVANSLKMRLYFYNTAGQTLGNVQILNWVVSGRILQSPNTYYSVASGNMDGAIWSPTTTGTGSAVNFTQELNAIVQTGHQVTQNLPNVSLNNLTIQAGGVLRANSTNAAAMRNISLFGNLVVNGVIGNGTTFDAIGLNIEGPTCSISGNGTVNLGRIRKQTAFNTTSNLTLQNQITNVRFPGAAIYNNAPQSYFNITIPSGRILNVTGSSGTNGDVSIDGIGDNDVDDKAGSITVNGTMNVTGNLSVASSNNNAPYNSALTLGATAIVTAISADLRVNATTNVTLTPGSRFTVSGVLRHRQGTLTTNNAVVLPAGAILLHGAGTPGITPDPGGLISGNVISRVTGTNLPGVYNYWSSPTTASNLSAIMQNGASTGSLLNTYMYNANNATDVTVEGLRDGWQQMNGSAVMTPGRGYITTTAGNVTFNGTPNNGLVSVPAIQGTFTRFNLVGNPYPGPIDAGVFLTANQTTNIFPALYFWDDDASFGGDYTTNDYIVTNAVGTVGTGGNGAAGAFAGRIATGQGFLVEARPGATSIEFTNSMRTTGAASFFAEPLPFSKLWLNVRSSEGLANETLLAFGEEATDGYDDRFDAKKMAASEQISLFTIANEFPMAIQAWSPITSTRIIPVGLNATQAGTYTFKIANLENFDETVLVYLEDMENGIFHNLRASEYSFSIEEALVNSSRFRLHFSAPVVVNADAESCSTQDGVININAPENSWNYSVQNATGLSIASGIASANTAVNQLPAGTYTINLFTADGYSVVKTVEVNAAQLVSVSAEVPANTAINQTVEFNATSTGASSISWNFGDGSAVLTGSTASHTYDAPGVYTVTVTASNEQCSSEIVSVVLVSDVATSTAQVVNEGVTLWPNPATDFFYVNTGSLKNAIVEVCDAAGKVLVRENLMNNQSNTISTAELSAGIYLVNVIAENGKQTFRLSVAH